MIQLTLIPAFGRTYKTHKEIIDAWDEGQTFLLQAEGHPYNGGMITKETAESGCKYVIRCNMMQVVL